MDPKRHSALNHVSATFAEWKSAQDMVRPLESELNAALLLHAEGRSPFPDELLAQVKTVKQKADALFARATDALQAIPSRR